MEWIKTDSKCGNCGRHLFAKEFKKRHPNDFSVIYVCLNCGGKIEDRLSI